MVAAGLLLLKVGALGLVRCDWWEASLLLCSPIAVLGVLMLILAATGGLPEWVTGRMDDERDVNSREHR
jgi:hypothetical protein